MGATKFAALGLLLGVGLFGGGYLAGRSGNQPAEVKKTDRLEQRSTSQEKLDAVIAEVKEARKDVAKNVERSKTTTRRPDGTVVVEEHVKDLSKTETNTQTKRTEVVTVEKRVEVVKVEVHEKLVLRRPEWMVGVSAGVNVPGLLGRATTSYLPAVFPSSVAKSTVFGVSVEKHLFWGVYGGINANTQGVVGLQVQAGF